MKIFVLNPGSTSTKIAMYQDGEFVWEEKIPHDRAWLKQFPTINAQLEDRYQLVKAAMAQHGEDLHDTDAIASRGGPALPVHAGAYRINAELVRIYRECPQDQHPSSLGAQIAYRLEQETGVPAHIYDAVSVDEMIDVVRITGLKEFHRRGQGHNLNMRAMGRKTAEEYLHKPYTQSTVIVCHMGGGISVSVQENGRIIDMVCDDEGPFAPERAGNIPNYMLVDAAFSGQYTKESMMRHLQREGGLISLAGTMDFVEFERRALENPADRLIMDAMALNVAKAVGQMAVVVDGKVEAITLTGGMAYCKIFVDEIRRRVGFIAPVYIIPGENEMRALAEGIGRVLTGEETADAI